MLERSPFKKISVLQMVVALESSGGRYIPDIGQVAEEHGTGILATQVVEDVIGHQKNDPAGKALQRCRRPSTSMHRALQDRILDVRHHFQTASMDVPLQAGARTLAPDAHHPAKKYPAGFDFAGVSGKAVTAPWFSPAAPQNGIPTADLFVLRALYATELKDQQLLELQWNPLFDVTHHFVFRWKADKEKQWYAALADWPGSGIVVLPLKLITARGHLYEFFVPQPLEQVLIKPVFDFKDIEACEVAWHGPGWLGHVFWPLKQDEFGIIAERISPPEPLERLVLRKVCIVS